MRHRSLFRLAFSGVLLASSVQAMASTAPAYTPTSLDNCGQSLSFSQPPSRIVTLGQNSAEIVLALGQAKRLAASGVWLDPVPEALREDASRIPVLAGRHPAFEMVLAQQPDLVAAQFVADIGPQGRTARREQFTQAGVPTYLSPTDCKQKVGASTVDGARQAPFTIDTLYQEIHELATIMGVPERGGALVTSLQQRIEHATRQQLAQDRRAPTVLYWFSSAQLGGDAWVAGAKGAPAWINRTLGVRNVIDSAEEWPAVSWERIAAADPDIIVIGSMARRHFTADDVEAKRQFLEQDPLARQLTAVREGRIVVMPARAMNPSLDTVEGVELLAKALRDFGWQR
ncbi:MULTISPECIES: ABC transporter substrate-binding protein [unclassified Zymobacter]|uniref:ABC transporter substrate-binding protein n=1 Tax=unclassified Zymobacter TaxID=3048685 RepID=UPI0039C01F44